MDNNISKTIGNRINTLLAEQGVKQKELAQHLQVPDNTISYFVKGTRTPNTSQITKIAQFFGVSSDYLLGLSNAESTDKDIQFISKFTGLSDTSIRILNCFNGSHIPQITNLLLETETCMLPEYLLDKSELESIKKENDNADYVIELKDIHELKNNEQLCFLTCLNDYFKISKKENNRLLSINPNGKLVDLNETDIETIETFDVDDIFSIMTISQYDIVEKVLLDRLVTYITTIKHEISDNNCDTKA